MSLSKGWITPKENTAPLVEVCLYLRDIIQLKNLLGQLCKVRLFLTAVSKLFPQHSHSIHGSTDDVGW